MLRVNTGILAGSVAALVCAIAVFFVLLRIAGHYVPFDHTPLEPLLFVHYRLPLAHLEWNRILLALGIWTASLLVLLSWIMRSRASHGSTTILIVTQGVLLAIFVMAPLPLDSDQYAYVGYASAIQHGDNAYAPHPLSATATLTQKRVAAHWGNPIFADRYGPIWTLANALFLWPIRNAPLETQAFVLRVLAAFAAIISSLLIALSVKDPRLRIAAVAAFALSPLVILASANGAHNDIFMVACALGAAYALRRERFALAALLLGLSIGIKFAYAPLALPFLAYVYVRTRRVPDTLVAAIAVAAPVTLGVLAFGVRASLIIPFLIANHGGSIVTSFPLLDHVGGSAVNTIVEILIVVAAVVSAIRIFQRRSPYAVLALLLCLILLLASKIEPWYALILTPALLMPDALGIALFFGISSGSLLMLSGSFLGVYPFRWAFVTAGALAVLAYVLLTKPKRLFWALFAFVCVPLICRGQQTTVGTESSPVPATLVNGAAFSQGGAAALPNPSKTTHAYFVYGVYYNGAAEPALAVWDLHTLAVIGATQIGTSSDQRSGAGHDLPSIILGGSGDAAIPYGAISVAYHSGVCFNATGTGPGTTYGCTPFKLVGPTESPSTVAADFEDYLPDANGHSEGWSMCWMRGAGAFTLSSGELARCIWGGQNQMTTYHLSASDNGGAQSSLTFHWTGLKTFWNDTVTTTTDRGPACGTVTKCYEPTPDTLYMPNPRHATNGTTLLVTAPNDGTFGVYKITGVAGPARASYVITLPNQGEPEGGTACRLTVATAPDETIAQASADFVNVFNGRAPTRGSGGSSTCAAWRRYYVEHVATVSNAGVPVAATAAAPVITFNVRPSASYTRNADLSLATFQNQSPSVGASTNIAVSRFTGTAGAGGFIKFQAGTACKMLAGWHDTGVCLGGINHSEASYYTSKAFGTGYSEAFTLRCVRPNDYHAGTWTWHTCDFRNSYTTSPGDAYTSDPAKGGLGIPTGVTRCASPQSPYVVKDPPRYAEGSVHFNCDWTAANDAQVGASSTVVFPIWTSMDVTWLPTGNLLIVYISPNFFSGLPEADWLVYDTKTGATDGQGHVDTQAMGITRNALPAISAGTAPSGNAYVAVVTGEMGARYNCPVTGMCTLLYELPAADAAAPSGKFALVGGSKLYSIGTTAALGNVGSCQIVQQDGLHLLCWHGYAGFSDSSNNTSYAAYYRYLH